MIRLVLLIALGASWGAAIPPPRECPTSLFGAQPSLTIYSTDGIQAALNYCKETCGTVIVDKPGVYLTGALRLTGCVHLQIPADVTLLAGDQVGCTSGSTSGALLVEEKGS